jgi:hypothetical protein
MQQSERNICSGKIPVRNHGGEFLVLRGVMGIEELSAIGWAVNSEYYALYFPVCPGNSITAIINLNLAKVQHRLW